MVEKHFSFSKVVKVSFTNKYFIRQDKKEEKEKAESTISGGICHFFVVWTEEQEPLERISFHFLIHTAVYAYRH